MKLSINHICNSLKIVLLRFSTVCRFVCFHDNFAIKPPRSLLSRSCEVLLWEKPTLVCNPLFDIYYCYCVLLSFSTIYILSQTMLSSQWRWQKHGCADTCSLNLTILRVWFFLFKCMNVLNFRQGDISVFSWHHLFLFSPIYQCVTFHALATATAFRRTSKAAKVRSLHTFNYVLVGCNFPLFWRRNIDEGHYLLQCLILSRSFVFI